MITIMIVITSVAILRKFRVTIDMYWVMHISFSAMTKLPLMHTRHDNQSEFVNRIQKTLGFDTIWIASTTNINNNAHPSNLIKIDENRCQMLRIVGKLYQVFLGFIFLFRCIRLCCDMRWCCMFAKQHDRHQLAAGYFNVNMWFAR